MKGCKKEEKKGILDQVSSSWEDPEPREGVSHSDPHHTMDHDSYLATFNNSENTG